VVPTRTREAPVKVRLEGTQQECAAATDRLRIVFEVVKVSRPYPLRPRPGTATATVRVYVEVRDKARPDAAAGRQPRAAAPRGRRANASREARRLANQLAARFGCPHGTFRFAWIGPTLGWVLNWQDGPSRQQTSQALAELASPDFPAFTTLLAEGKLRTHRDVSQRAWALHLVGVAAAGGGVPDLDDTTVWWDTLEHLVDEVAFPERPPTPAADAAAQELLGLAQALQPVGGQGPSAPVEEQDLARLLRRRGVDAIASGTARQALHDRAGVTALASGADRSVPRPAGEGPRRDWRP
jgi:hypothetical protein